MRLRLSGHRVTADCLVSIQSPLVGAKMCAMFGHLERINLYRAALRETDPDKLQARIEEAEQAMRVPLRIAVEYEDSVQSHFIGDAQRQLESVRQHAKVTGQYGDTRGIR